MKNFFLSHWTMFVPCTASDGQLHGLYIRSFCRGLDLVLTDYRDALLSLEQEILRDPHLPVSHLQYSLQEVTIFRHHTSLSLIRSWDGEGVWGCVWIIFVGAAVSVSLHVACWIFFLLSFVCMLLLLWLRTVFFLDLGVVSTWFNCAITWGPQTKARNMSKLCDSGHAQKRSLGSWNL